MRLDQYLVKRGLFESRNRAQEAIKLGYVKVAGERITKAGFKVSDGAEVTAKSLHPYVSRGGLKLAHALREFNVDVRGKVCLDVGASTGGFTDVLIQNGARHVYAVDVGHGQLHRRLQGRDDVTSLEGTDARGLTADMFAARPTMIVCDASFISLTKVLGAALAIPATGAQLMALVKPQFEVGKAGIGKGGIVKSETDALMALSDISAWIQSQGWHVSATTDSPIKGGSGNHEYLLHAVKQ
ncbi:TlyA family RNA methyltransferase [Fretibacter rubidus]|uniref:TlyA family RNA methyltransferase n=1 Tax=Fretibacter rubidus TaxID=570162 RepID=UPI00352A2A2F